MKQNNHWTGSEGIESETEMKEESRWDGNGVGECDSF